MHFAPAALRNAAKARRISGRGSRPSQIVRRNAWKVEGPPGHPLLQQFPARLHAPAKCGPVPDQVCQPRPLRDIGQVGPAHEHDHVRRPRGASAGRFFDRPASHSRRHVERPAQTLRRCARSRQHCGKDRAWWGLARGPIHLVSPTYFLISAISVARGPLGLSPN